MLLECDRGNEREGDPDLEDRHTGCPEKLFDKVIIVDVLMLLTFCTPVQGLSQLELDYGRPENRYFIWTMAINIGLKQGLVW